MRKVFFLLLLLPFFQNCLAQKKYTTSKTAKGKLLATFERGVRMTFNGQLPAAVLDFEKALQMDPTFIDAQIEWANVKNQQGKLAEAELGYKKALAIDPAYEVNIYYSLAIVQFEQGKLDMAGKHFEQFLASPPDKTTTRRRERANRYLENIRFVTQTKRDPVPFEPVNLGPNINTPLSEYLPTLTADGKTLIYCTLQREPSGYRHEDFFRSKKVNGEWQKGEPIAAINTIENEGSQTISADGKLLIFTACNRPGGMGGCDLYFTESVNGQMTPVKNLGPPVNTSLLETQPSLSADGKTLYFVRAPRNWEGNSDIWVSKRNPDGTWGDPTKLGPEINTPEQEQCPFIHPDGQTLYFLSEGHPGMGGIDIFFSRLQPDGTWGKPQNIGYPINSVKNEGPIFVSLDGKTAFFASERDGGYGENDIYQFELYEAARPRPVTYVKAVVTDALTGKTLPARVEFTDITDGRPYASSMTEADGEFLVTLPDGRDYALNVSKDGYLFHSENFALAAGGTLEEPFLLNISLMPIPTGLAGTGDLSRARPVVLKNIFFETGSASLKKESITELNYLKKLLKDNPAMKIQINGHTDDVGSEADNLKLSEARAKAVHDFLTENGIDPKRLKYKGFGESMPVASNETDEGRRQNRRTEFVIIE